MSATEKIKITTLPTERNHILSNVGITTLFLKITTGCKMMLIATMCLFFGSVIPLIPIYTVPFFIVFLMTLRNVTMKLLKN